MMPSEEHRLNGAGSRINWSGCVVLTFSSSYREVTPSRIPVCRSTDSHLSIWISITLGCLCSFGRSW